MELGCDALHSAERAASVLGRQRGGHLPHGPQGVARSIIDFSSCSKSMHDTLCLLKHRCIPIIAQIYIMSCYLSSWHKTEKTAILHGRLSVLERAKNCLKDQDQILNVCIRSAQADIDFQTPPWPSISQAAKDCVRQLLNVAPDGRPTASKLLQVRCLLATQWPLRPSLKGLLRDGRAAC